MAFKDTLQSVMTKKKLDHGSVAELMSVSVSQVYRYLNGTSEPKYSGINSLFEGSGYELKVSKKSDTK